MKPISATTGCTAAHILRCWLALVGVTATGVLVATAARAGSIFDDDWPPRRAETQPATPVTPVPVVPVPVAPPVKPRITSVPVPPPPSRSETPAPREIVRRAIPDKPQITHSRDLLKEAFATQLADRSIPARRQLAQTLLTEAGKAAASPPDQYALFGGAMNAAKEGAALRLACQVADEWAKSFEVDAWAMKIAASLKMPLKADTPANTIENALAGLDLVDFLVGADDYASASRLCSVLRAATAGDPLLAGVVQKRSQEVDALRTGHDRVAPMLERLKTAPDDPSANLAVGSYRCFTAGDWATGLPMLAKGSDAELKRLATDESTRPADVEAVLRIADGWWAVASRQPVNGQVRVRQHAAALYSSALAGSSPLQRLKIEKRVAEASAKNGDSGGGLATINDLVHRQRVSKIKAFLDKLAVVKAGRQPYPVGEPLEGESTLPAKAAGYSLDGELSVGHNAGNHGKVKKDCTAKVVVEAGFNLEGGTLLVSKGSLDLRGDPAHPIVLKGVRLMCELTGSVKATNVVFDNCVFSKEGPYGWNGYGAISSKWEFTDCLLYQSNFKSLQKNNYGLKIKHCTFVDCKLPGRDNKPGKSDDSAKDARWEWSRIVECAFYDCELSASDFWILDRCDLEHCTAADTAAFNSETDLNIELSIPAAERERLLSDLRGRMNLGGTGKVTFTAAAAPYANPVFPKP